jgi:N-acylglucosamine-6-phosphate 2-epimerase
MLSKTEILKRLKGGLIVSCQAEPEKGGRLHEPAHIALMAKEVLDAGACAVRICGADTVQATRAINPNAIIIGIGKQAYDDGCVLITGSSEDVIKLFVAGADVVGLDMTKRARPWGQSSAEVFQDIRAHRDYATAPLMADIADEAEARAASMLGADFVATTLSGYTPDTEHRLKPHPWYEYAPDEELVSSLVSALPDTPVIAEGRWREPEQCHRAIRELGAYAVCVGSQVTRPRMQVAWHLAAVKRSRISG